MVVSDILSKENTLPIRGFVAILVLLSHFQLMWPISNIGYLCVAIFFFFSGYGLMYSYLVNSNYIDSFLQRRLPSVIIPYWSSCIVYIILITILGYQFSIKVIFIGILNPFLDSFRFISVAWYVCVIVLFYILFYLSFRFFSGKKALFFLTIGLFLYGILAVKFKPDYWSMSFSTFLLGLLLGYFNDKEIKISNYQYYLTSIVSILFFALIFIKYPSFFGKQISSLLIVLLMMLLLIKISFKRNIVLKFYGEISYEFYLLHPLIIQFVNNHNIFVGPTKDRESCYWPYIYSLEIENRLFQFFIIILITSLLSFMLNKLNKKLLYSYNLLIK